MRPITRSHAAVVLGAVLMVGGGGCGGGGGGGGGAHVPDVSGVVGTAGGQVAHAAGVRLEVPAGALSGNATLTIDQVDLPGALTSGVTARSAPFELSAGGAALAAPVTVRFPLSAADLALPGGSLGLYRWDGQQWLYGGGVLSEDTLTTTTSGFSIWIVGTGRSLHKPLHFYNTGSFDARVSVHQYELAHPDLDRPISPAWGFMVGAAVLPEVEARFPQGQYSFCAEWWKPTPDTSGPARWVHKYVGNHPPPPNDWTYGLDQDSNDLVPVTVWFDTGIPYLEARCPGAQNVSGGDLPPAWMDGGWLVTVRCTDDVQDAVDLTVQLARTGATFKATGTGTHSTGIRLAATVEGTYAAGSNAISGTIAISAVQDIGVGRTDGFSTALARDTGFVTLSKISATAPIEGICVLEARFVKQGS